MDDRAKRKVMSHTNNKQQAARTHSSNNRNTITHYKANKGITLTGNTGQALAPTYYWKSASEVDRKKKIDRSPEVSAATSVDKRNKAQAIEVSTQGIKSVDKESTR